MISKKFSKHLSNIEYHKEKTSWNIAGVLEGQNAFYKFDVRGMIKESKDRAYKTGHLNSKADKILELLQSSIVFEARVITFEK